VPPSVRTYQVFGDEDCAFRKGPWVRTQRSAAIDTKSEYLGKVFMSFLHHQGKKDQLIWQKTHPGFVY
jgi:hypothetical protein